MSDGPGWVCEYKGELAIVDHISEYYARGGVRKPGNGNKDSPMSPSGGISRVRARESCARHSDSIRSTI